ncbi:hypothetical protein B0H13DRAFT_2421035 [Mycena leptocephala]|nr:hypothetical protein B0H13DRAFT_2421035 [Mycena leptocephala]
MLPPSPNNLDNILQYTAVASNALQDLATATQIPFLNSISTLSSTIIPIVQGMRFQKDRCLGMMEGIHQLLYTLMSLYIYSDDIRSPKMLNQIAQCALMLQKFHSCLQAQQELGTIKRIFRQNEIVAQMDRCEAELKATLEVLIGVRTASALAKFSIDTEKRHQELLELIASQNGSIDTASSIGTSSLNTSSGSLYLLPASPKIFRGRDSELKDLIDSLLSDPARVAILGPGGMGKTTLAMAALHHPEIMEKYNLRHFISCESANTCGDLVTNIGLYLGLEPSFRLSNAIVHHFGQCGPCLVVLDNFETPWEPFEPRAQVEEFLSLLADIPSLALLPLSLSASRRRFVDVADEPGSSEESVLDDLLHLSGSLPLAVSLMANIALFEGYSTTLARWQAENTALLSDGHDKRANLEKSISLSLSSPRISSSPHAKNLISLLSLLPDGIKLGDIIAGKVPIPNVRQCQSVLVGTSLAYIDVKGRLKTLSPVREYIRQLLDVWKSKHLLPSGNLATELVGHLGNINELFLEGLLTKEKSAWITIADSIMTLDLFSGAMLKGHSQLFQRLPHLIQATGDAALRWAYTSQILTKPEYHHLIQDPAVLIEEDLQYFNDGNRPVRQAVSFYNSVGRYYNDISKATEFNARAFALAYRANDIDLQLICLEYKSQIAYKSQDPYRTFKVAHKARDIARSMWSSHWEYFCLRIEVWGHLWMGNLTRALELCAQTEELLTSVGMENSTEYLLLLDKRGNVLFQKSEYQEVRQLYAQIIKKTSASCSFRYHAHALRSVAEMDILMESEVADIVSNLKAAETVEMTLVSPDILTTSLLDAQLKLYCGDTENSRAALLECLSKGLRTRTGRALVRDCLAALADPVHKMHGTMDAFCWAVVYLASVQIAKNPVGTLHALRRLADLHLSLEDDETALHIFHAVLEGGTKMDIHRLRAECMVGIGDIVLRRGNPIEAKEMWGGTHPLFTAPYVPDVLLCSVDTHSPLVSVVGARAIFRVGSASLLDTLLAPGPSALPLYRPIAVVGADVFIRCLGEIGTETFLLTLATRCHPDATPSLTSTAIHIQPTWDVPDHHHHAAYHMGKPVPEKLVNEARQRDRGLCCFTGRPSGCITWIIPPLLPMLLPSQPSTFSREQCISVDNVFTISSDLLEAYHDNRITIDPQDGYRIVVFVEFPHLSVSLLDRLGSSPSSGRAPACAEHWLSTSLVAMPHSMNHMIPQGSKWSTPAGQEAIRTFFWARTGGSRE